MLRFSGQRKDEELTTLTQIGIRHGTYTRGAGKASFTILSKMFENDKTRELDVLSTPCQCQVCMVVLSHLFCCTMTVHNKYCIVSGIAKTRWCEPPLYISPSTLSVKPLLIYFIVNITIYYIQLNIYK